MVKVKLLLQPKLVQPIEVISDNLTYFSRLYHNYPVPVCSEVYSPIYWFKRHSSLFTSTKMKSLISIGSDLLLLSPFAAYSSLLTLEIRFYEPFFRQCVRNSLTSSFSRPRSSDILAFQIIFSNSHFFKRSFVPKVPHCFQSNRYTKYFYHIFSVRNIFIWLQWT